MSDFVWWLETDDSAGPAMYPYFVQYIDKDTGDHLMEEKKVYAPYGIEVTEQAPVIPGYTPDAESKTITIKVEGNTITFYYEREEGVPDEPSVPPDDPGEYPPDDPGAEPSEKPGSVQTGNDLRESNTLPIIYSLLAIACVLGILLVIFFRTAETRKKKGNNDVR